MKNLVSLELKKFSLRPHLIGLIAANIIILFLSVMLSSLMASGGNVSPIPGLPPLQIDTISLAIMLVRAALIVWEAVFISSLIIEEYRNKTISLLFTYPVSRIALIWAKLFLICGIMLVFHILSGVFQHSAILLLSGSFDFVTYSFGNPAMYLITAISTILFGMIPLFVGMTNKSTITTIVSSIIIVAISSNSQGSMAGLLSIPIVAVVFGIIGVISAAVVIRKMAASDLYN